MRRGTAVLFMIALAAPMPVSGTALLGPEDDAGSGRDAGDDFAEALPLVPGRYQGNVSHLGDLDDYYVIDLPLGAWATFDVRSKGTAACAGGLCVGLVNCATLRLYAPDKTEREDAYCGISPGDDDYHSTVYFFIVDQPGGWYVRVSAGTPLSDLPEQTYTLSVRVRAVHDSFFRSTFHDVHAAAVRLDPGLGDYHALFLTDTLPDFEGAADADFVALSFEPGKEEFWGFARIPGAHASIRPVAAAQVVGVDAAVRVDLPGIASPNKAGFLVEGHASEAAPFVMTLAASRPFSATLRLAYDGNPDVQTWEDHEGDHLIGGTVSQFHASTKVVTPVGGVVEDAWLEHRLGPGFAGFFRLSNPSQSLDDRVGGYIDPAGHRVQLDSPDHPHFLAWLVQPLPGAWTFWLDHDRGVMGDPRLLFGVDLPQGLVQSAEASSPTAR